MALSGDELRELYDRVAAARRRFQDLAVQATPRAKLFEHARALGLPTDPEMGQPAPEEIDFAYDLAIYTAPRGRSRSIDRVAKQHARLPGEAALVLNALTRSWLSIFRVLDRHPEEGLLLEDCLFGGEVWLIDQGIAETAPAGTLCVSRVGRVLGFAITTGVVVALDEGRFAGIRAILRSGDVTAQDVVDDPRFARTMWQLGLGMVVGPG